LTNHARCLNAVFRRLSSLPLADAIGRGPFFLYFLGAVVTFPIAFLTTSSVDVLFLLIPFVGIFTLGVTSGFPIYLPELFPTAVRTTVASITSAAS
jgi:hypothetical protein